jgi:hypothetical protein
MAVLSIQRTSLTGLNPAFAAASGGGDSMPNTGNEVLEVKCGGTGCTITFTAQKPCNHGVLHNAVIVVPANETREIGPFIDTNRWNDASGRLQWTYNQVTTVTVAAKSV